MHTYVRTSHVRSSSQLLASLNSSVAVQPLKTLQCSIYHKVWKGYLWCTVSTPMHGDPHRRPYHLLHSHTGLLLNSKDTVLVQVRWARLRRPWGHVLEAPWCQWYSQKLTHIHSTHAHLHEPSTPYATHKESPVRVADTGMYSLCTTNMKFKQLTHKQNLSPPSNNRHTWLSVLSWIPPPPPPPHTQHATQQILYIGTTR